MQSLLDFLRGKKSAIGTITGAVITFCLARGYIQADVAMLLSTTLAALGIAVNTAEHYQSKKV